LAWRIIEKLIWTGHIANEVLAIEKERTAIDKIRKRQRNWIGNTEEMVEETRC